MNHLIQTNVPLKDKNWFNTGGSARYFAQPQTAQEFQYAVEYASQKELPIFILGKGANILISDEGFDGLVIQPQLNEISILPSQEHILVKAGAGASMHDLILFCLDHSIIGLEEFSGIPGTVGGSLYINLHYYEFLLEQFLFNATVLDKKTNQYSTIAPDWFAFGYNKSKLQEEQFYLVDATFILKKATDLETAFARGRRKEIIRHREKRYPAKNTCGSFFRNFLDHEVTLVSNNKKIIYVAYYLDKIGVKGHLRIGNAIVSHQHANMIVNQGNATSTDIITLARTMQELVYKEFGVLPQPECRLIGFAKNPLL